jgi:hypothetical protein
MHKDDVADIDRGLRAVVDDMVAAWPSAPAPAPTQLGNVDSDSLSDAAADAVASAWTARVVRTAQAVLILCDNGFSHESAPLVRSMLEHAVAIWWIADKRGAAYQSLIRGRARAMQLFADAQSTGWHLGDDGQQLLETAINVETDEGTVSGDHLLHARQRAAEYGLGSFHQAFLVETWTAHPTLMSALPYYTFDNESLITQVHLMPKDDGRRAVAAACAALHLALTGYEQLVPDAFAGRLSDWQRRFEALELELRMASQSQEPSRTSSEGKPSTRGPRR